MKHAALLCGFPIHKSDFLRQIDQPESSDFLTLSYSKLERSSPEHAWQNYHKLVKALELVLDEFRELGFTVFEAAKPADFQTACNEFNTILLLAHWRHWEFFPHHFRDIDETIRLLTEGSRVIDEECRKDLTSRPSIQHEATAVILNAFLKRSVSRQLTPTEHLRTKMLEAARIRDRLDLELDGLALPGNRLELSGSMYLPSQLARGKLSKPTLIDLLVCRSYYLATALKSEFGEKSLFVSGHQPVSVSARAKIALKAAKIAAKHKVGYYEALLALRDQLAH